MTEKIQTADVIIVGMGVCGISAAIQIQKNPTLKWLGIDKGRSIGGRLATRRIGAETFDHGAQFFTARSPDFNAVVKDALGAGIIKEWCRGFKGKSNGAELDGFPRFMAKGGMNQFAKALSRDLVSDRVIVNRKISDIYMHSNGFCVKDSMSQEILSTNLILTAPVPQALEMLGNLDGIEGLQDAKQSLSSIHYDPCIAVMALFDVETIPNLDIPFQFADGAIAFLSDNGRKGISSSDGALTIHLSADASRECFSLGDDEVFNFVHTSLRRLFPDSSFVLRNIPSIHRWRYASPRMVLDAPYLELTGKSTGTGPVQKLFFAGEAFAGPKIEGAYLSGLAVGRRVSEIHGSNVIKRS